jgi:hypothetical protein
MRINEMMAKGQKQGEGKDEEAPVVCLLQGMNCDTVFASGIRN